MKNENPTLSKKSRASRVMVGTGTQEANNPTVYQVQHLIARHALTLESAAIIAALAFGGSQYG